MPTDAERWQFIESLPPMWRRKDDPFREEYHVLIAFITTKKYESLREMVDAGIAAKIDASK